MKGLRRVVGLVVLALIIYGVLSSVGRILQSDPRANYPISYPEEILTHAQANGLDPFLVAAVIKVESNFQATAKSHAGARGLMQIMPETGAWISQRQGEVFSEEGLDDPKQNIAMGTYFLRYLKDEFGTWPLALAAYNGGPTNVKGWLENPEYSKDGKTLDHIPFKETREYVTKVLDYEKTYRKLYQGEFPRAEL